MSNKLVVLAGVVCLVVGMVLAVSFNRVNRKVTEFDITIDGASTANVGELVEYTLTFQNKPWFFGTPVVLWGVFNGETNVVLKELTNTDIVFTTGSKPGTCTLVVGGALSYNYFFWTTLQPIGLWSKQITVGTPTPTPKPVPVPPTPKVAPTAMLPTETTVSPPKLSAIVPVDTPLYVVCVFDLDELYSLSAYQYSLYTSTTLKPSLSSLNTTLLVFDKTNPIINKPNWSKRINLLGGLPVFVVHDKEGNVVYSDKLPPDEPTLLSIVKNLRGL